MTEQDRLHEYILARVAATETWLMLIWNELQNRSAVKTNALNFIEAREAVSLHEPTSDEVLAIQKRARQESFDAVFHELLAETDRDELRSLSAQQKASP
jgi:hypothetical protein